MPATIDRHQKFWRAATLCGGLSMVPSASISATSGISVSTGIDEQARLPFWETSDRGMSLRLVQRLPDQTRGFFEARGFSKARAERIAQSCVFQTVFKNISGAAEPSPLDYNLREWVVAHKGRTQGMKTREDWNRAWRENNTPKPARIAFEWALMPTRQRYAPGDYNWGMSMFNLAPGTRFDLTVTWRQHGENRQAVIKGIECAPDIHPTPAELGSP